MNDEFTVGLVRLDWLNPAKTYLRISSRPWPIAIVEIRFNKKTQLWDARNVSESYHPGLRSWADRGQAMTEASETVARRARHLWRESYTGIQRYAIGQQKCPYWMGSKVCGQPPEVGTIWCSWHPQGRPKGV